MIAEEKKIWKIREQLEDLTEENYKLQKAITANI